MISRWDNDDIVHETRIIMGSIVEEIVKMRDFSDNYRDIAVIYVKEVDKEEYVKFEQQLKFR